MKVIPAIDIVDGKCVRLTQGDFDQKTIYSDDPVRMATQFERLGVQNLHLVDLDGAKNGKVTNWETIERVVSSTGLQVDFGGGIKAEIEIERLLKLGIKRVNIGSHAIRQPKLVADWITFFGPDRIILSADFKNDKVAANGWTAATGMDVMELLDEFVSYGIEYVTCTDISRDGMLNGPNNQFYKDVIKKFPSIQLTASGGIRSREDLKELQKIGIYGAIVGKAIYEKKIDLTGLVKEFSC